MPLSERKNIVNKELKTVKLHLKIKNANEIEIKFTNKLTSIF